MTPMKQQIMTNRHICLLSGGKDSTALALYLRDTRPELDIEYVFNDTHMELPETYEYLVKVEAYLGKPIIRLCSDKGSRGFEHFLKKYRGFLPSPSVRWCTKLMKIKPFEDYIGDEEASLYIGIRADERREGYISTKPNLKPYYPFVENGINKPDVFRILKNSGVGIPKYYDWRSRSGCFFCFFQRQIEWVGLYENHPDLYQRAMDFEKPDEGFTWIEGESLEELKQPERREEIKIATRKRELDRIRRKKPATLAEVFSPDTIDPDEDTGCLICHL